MIHFLGQPIRVLIVTGVFAWTAIGGSPAVQAQPRPDQTSPVQNAPAVGSAQTDASSTGVAAGATAVPAQLPTNSAQLPTNSAQLPAAPAQTTDPSSPAPPPTPATTAASAATLSDGTTFADLLNRVTERQQQLASDAERTPESVESLNKLYEQIKVDVDAASKALQKRLERNESAQAAPAVLEATRLRKEELSKKSHTENTDDLSSMTFEEADAVRKSLEAELATATAERTALSETSARRELRRKELPQLISDARSKLEQLNGLPTGTPPTDDPIAKEATAWSAEMSRRVLSEELQGLEAEQKLYEAETLLLPAKLELAQSTEKKLQDRVRVVNAQLDKIRTDRIQAQFSQAKELVQKLPESFEADGQQLLQRISDWRKLAGKQAELKIELEAARNLLSRWNDRRTRMNSRIDPKPNQEGVSEFISGFNSWVGLMLRKQRNELPVPSQLAARIRYYLSEIQESDSVQYDLEDSLQEIRIQRESFDGDVDSTQPNDAALTPEATRILQFLAQKEEVLRAIQADVNSYVSDLVDIADVRENTISLSNEYRAFIDKHVLWIRSTEPLNRNDWATGVEAFRWLVDYQNWRMVLGLLKTDALRRFGWYVLFSIALVFFLANQSRLRRTLSEHSAKAEKNNCVDFRLTARSLLITFLITLPAPLILLFGYWRITTVVNSSLLPAGVDGEFANALARGLLITTSVFVPLELLRQLCRTGGLGIKHFGWKEPSSRRLSTNLRWLIDFTIPLTLIVGIFLTQNNQRWESSLGRLAFVMLMPLLSIFLARVFALKTGVISSYLENHRGGWLDRLGLVWFPILIFSPLLLAAVSIVGYHYTAQRIGFHVVTTLWTVVLLLLAYFLMMRWLVLNRRKLMLAQARQRLEEAARRDPQSELAGMEEPRVNLVAINDQTKRLVSSLIVATSFVVLYLIWSDVLPAVSMLDGFKLWPIQGALPDETVWITLADLLLVIPVIVLAIIAVRNVPGLLEIAFLQHLPLTSAARYAVTTLSRYALAGLGIVIISSTIGLRWSSIQWLVAALGVGLGFGLQEIFANFVSGLILLFEQPIRVGDIVTVDGTTGSVSKIRMRATTIVNWDRQELVVPNKDFITGKLLNWTLTDSTNRIVINVGVAYGSDTRRACELIKQVCSDNSCVLDEPAPNVTFEGFGDNSLNLVLRAYLASLENRLLTIHELHQQIYTVFNESGIEIAFPQRDLHIRTLPESWNRWFESQPARQHGPSAIESKQPSSSDNGSPD